jgi:hypothetical protein
MATLAFIPYIPKVSNPKSANKPPFKGIPKQFRSFNNSQRIAAKENKSPLQRVDSDDRAAGQRKPRHLLATML